MLAARTDFWKFENGGDEKSEIQISDDVDFEAFHVAIRWIYTDEIDLKMEDEKLLKVCETATSFRLEQLKNV